MRLQVQLEDHYMLPGQVPSTGALKYITLTIIVFKSPQGSVSGQAQVTLSVITHTIVLVRFLDGLFVEWNSAIAHAYTAQEIYLYCIYTT